MSIQSILSLLNNKCTQIQQFALNQLLVHVDTDWPEISENLSTIEEIFENADTNNKTIAAIVISKIYYHLTEYKEALKFGLDAQHLLDEHQDIQYRQTINNICIQEYISMKKLQKSRPTDKSHNEYLNKLEITVNKMFEECFVNNDNSKVIGIALETERIDIIERAIVTTTNKNELLTNVFKLSSQLIKDNKFRNTILKKIIDLSLSVSERDYFIITQCLTIIDDAKTTAEILTNLLVESHESSLLAYQLAFDICENSSPYFLLQTILYFHGSDMYLKMFSEMLPTESEIEDHNMTNDIQSQSSIHTEMLEKRFMKIDSILSKEKEREIHSQFLLANNNGDKEMMNKLKELSKNDMTRNATILTNGFMNCGTSCDSIVKDENINSLVNWAKFNVVSTVGVIYRGDFKKAIDILKPYLPSENMGNKSSYAAGGSLFGVGLASANYSNEEVINFLLMQSSIASIEPVKHGLCLGLGLASMGTGRDDIYDQLKSHLYTDDAIVGEAASIGMGLVKLGAGQCDALNEMLSYITDTTHEKISRGLVLSISMTMLNKQTQADTLIESLLNDKNPMMRLTGASTISLAYCGTSNEIMVNKLLKLAVTDTSDDVRRCAASGIGYVLCRNHDKIPYIIESLSESYNAHVRYGCAMALGIGCAGTAMKEAISIVERLLDDKVEFVRQGAYISMAMILMQQNEIHCRAVKEFRQKIMTTISDKTHSSMSKFGAILAVGILNAGGQNMEISLINRNGCLNVSAVVGLFVFQNYWFWFPLANFLSLSFTPTFVALLDEDLNLSKETILCQAKKSTFSYLESFKEEKVAEKKEVKPVVLSIKKTTNKKTDSEIKDTISEIKDTREEKEEDQSFIVENLSRIVSTQLKHIELEQDTRGRVIKCISKGGIVMMKNTNDGKPIDPENIEHMDI